MLVVVKTELKFALVNADVSIGVEENANEVDGEKRLVVSITPTKDVVTLV